jgi:apurinic endonuclease APN1
MPKVGAHVSAAVSLETSFLKAQEIGAECTQIFISPPQRWLHQKHDEAEILRFNEKKEESGIGPIFIHGAYLINLASQNPENLQKSIDWLIYSLKMADKLGITGTIFHTGSSGTMERKEALTQVVKAISQILANTPNNPYLIIETAAGAGNTIGDELFEIGEIVHSVKNDKLRVCIDTQHMFASGYDLRSKEELDKVFEIFDTEIGLKNLLVAHLNDSKTPLGSNKDRHENIGEGEIGREAFQRIVRHQALKEIPLLLEVPGFGDNGPDKENIDLVKSFLQ